MIILGIDPGTARIGYGVIRLSVKRPALVACGLLAVRSKDQNIRVAEAALHFEKLVAQHSPDLLAIEKLFFVNNRTNGLKVAEIRGALLLEAQKSGLRISQHAPTEVKKSVAGFGGADKRAVSKMVKLILGLKEIPGPDDVSDALAICLTAASELASERFLGENATR